ncbi:MAG TPA: beta-ketoacyl-ACP synthase III [Smithellaceae bacterium]|nr:beta-ketoacyl-ACP synthase III [Smithellaceae bacterium]HQM44381.1 beta-ketoacyl-ACP synthase III [Smithellaceae bacterium]
MKKDIVLFDLDDYTFTNAKAKKPKYPGQGLISLMPTWFKGFIKSRRLRAGQRRGMEVYINDIAAFLPNDPVPNDEMEAVLGKVHDIPSPVKDKILKNNGIRLRYYAIDRNTGKLNFTNAQLAANAIQLLKPHENFSINEIQCLCCGTTMADVMAPGHASMVAGDLGLGPCEVISTSGICLSGITALKAAYANVALGWSENAVATGSELASSLLISDFFEHLPEKPDLMNNPVLVFESDFLRWMLSDAAGAVFLSSSPNQSGLSLRLDWIEHISFAGQMETCMYAGGHKNEDGTVTGWRQLGSLEVALKRNDFALKQDTKLLGQHIVRLTVQEGLSRTIARRGIRAVGVDWFLPHYSSEYFRDKVHDAMVDIGFDIPFERWFTNLSYKGNTGSASIYVMMEELFHSGKIQKGQTLLCYIPESGRFSTAFMQLTAV